MRWVLGDIHGMLAPLRALLSEIGRLDPSPRFYFTGDYVNRGPSAAAVVDLLLTLPNARFCRGNHDDTFDLILHGTSFGMQNDGVSPAAAFEWFMQHGLATTLGSYGVPDAQLRDTVRFPNAQKLAAVTAAVPEAHRNFIRSLEPAIEDDDFFIAHAYWSPDAPTETPDLTSHLIGNPKLRHQLVWGRFSVGEILQVKQWRRVGIFGHTPVLNYVAQGLGDRNDPNTPITGPQIVLIDTGAALGAAGRLTAFCCDSGRYIQADPQGRIVELQPAAPPGATPW